MKRFLGLMCLFLLVGCQARLDIDDLPTPFNPDAAATAQYLTENAPPPGHRSPIDLTDITLGTRLLSGWRYTMFIGFEGLFAGTPRTTTGRVSATVWFNQLATSRRVLLETQGDLLEHIEPIGYEGVRIGRDAFLVTDNACQTNATGAAETIADFTASSLIGGVRQAIPQSQPATINGQRVWRYEFAPESVIVPSIQLAEGGRVTLSSGELWFAPEHDVVIRYYVNLDVENAIVFGSVENENRLPVSGRVVIQYDLLDIGEVPNISIPFGC